ncbi:hypothetical protein Hanom_Chr11g01024131 [Helianthus anomalus]
MHNSSFVIMAEEFYEFYNAFTSESSETTIVTPKSISKYEQ